LNRLAITAKNVVAPDLEETLTQLNPEWPFVHKRVPFRAVMADTHRADNQQIVRLQRCAGAGISVGDVDPLGDGALNGTAVIIWPVVS